MKYNLIIGIIIFSILWFISRYISEQGIKHLNDEEKTKLVEVLSKFRLLNMIIPLVILFVFFGFIIFYTQGDKILILLTLFVLFFLYMLAVNIVSLISLKKANIPAGYIKNFVLSRLIGVLSIVLIAASLLLPF